VFVGDGVGDGVVKFSSWNVDGGWLHVRNLRLKDKVLARLETLLQYPPRSPYYPRHDRIPDDRW
jgi:hypothetical protein